VTTALRLAVEGSGPRADALSVAARLSGWRVVAPGTGDVDVVAVVDPSAASVDAIVRHLRAGRHVIADPPWCRDLAEADRVVEASTAAGRAVLHAEYPAHAPAVAALLQEVPLLGTIRHIEARFLAPTGSSTPVEIPTLIRRLAPTPLAIALLASRRAGIPTPTGAALTDGAQTRRPQLRLDVGDIARVSITVGLHPGTANVCDVQVAGDSGVARAEVLPAPMVERDGVEIALRQPAADPPELEMFGHLEQLRSLATAIRHGAAPVTDAAFGRQVLALILDALDRS